MNTGRMPYENEGRVWEYPFIKKGIPKIVANH